MECLLLLFLIILNYYYIARMAPKRKADPDDSRQRKRPTKASQIETIDSDNDFYQQFLDLSTELVLKPDHERRPIWISKDKLIFLEAFSPLYQQACDFLVAVAEPESRPEFIHVYRLTENSLNAAVALSIDADSIIKVLNRLSKTNVPSEVSKFVKEATYTFGKAKIVLKNNCYYIESKFPEVLRELLRNPKIAEAREKQETDSFLESAAPFEDSRNLDITKIGLDMADEDDDVVLSEEDLILQHSKANSVSFMLKSGTARLVKKTAKDDSKYPLMEEYDFKHDHRNPNLEMTLRPSTKIRVSTVVVDMICLIFVSYSPIRKNRYPRCLVMVERDLGLLCFHVERESLLLV